MLPACDESFRPERAGGRMTSISHFRPVRGSISGPSVELDDNPLSEFRRDLEHAQTVCTRLFFRPHTN